MFVYTTKAASIDIDAVRAAFLAGVSQHDIARQFGAHNYAAVTFLIDTHAAQWLREARSTHLVLQGCKVILPRLQRTPFGQRVRNVSLPANSMYIAQRRASAANRAGGDHV